MSALVTKEHRERACKALGIAKELHARKWVATGDDASSNADMRDVAQAMADGDAVAETRGRANERADVLQRLDNELADDEHGESWQLLEREDFEYLRASIARGDHVRRGG